LSPDVFVHRQPPVLSSKMSSSTAVTTTTTCSVSLYVYCEPAQRRKELHYRCEMKELSTRNINSYSKSTENNFDSSIKYGLFSASVKNDFKTAMSKFSDESFHQKHHVETRDEQEVAYIPDTTQWFADITYSMEMNGESASCTKKKYLGYDPVKTTRGVERELEKQYEAKAWRMMGIPYQHIPENNRLIWKLKHTTAPAPAPINTGFGKCSKCGSTNINKYSGSLADVPTLAMFRNIPTKNSEYSYKKCNNCGLYMM